MTKNNNSVQLQSPKIRCRYLQEPQLLFGNDGKHVDPKRGILRFGPKSYNFSKRHPSSVRVGIIGSAETIGITREWLDTQSAGVSGDEEHPDFPGYKADRGFFSDLVHDDNWTEQIYRSDMEDLLKITPTRVQFETTLAMLEDKLRLMDRKDYRPDYVVVALPDDLYNKCRVTNYRDPHLGEVHRDLRRAFKSIAMKYRMPTQILRQVTVAQEGPRKLDGSLKKDHASEIAWDFFTGLYFKAGGFPWGPVGLTPGTCYIGVGFFRPLGSSLRTMQTSLMQAFDEHGDGLVLRGQDFTWDAEKEGTSSPHLSEQLAHELVEMVLSRYQDEMRQTPRRVVVHKTSRFWPQEKRGFEVALRKNVAQYDLIAMAPQSTVRLLTTNLYPPLRGTQFSIEELDYIYTTGYISSLGQFHSNHVPSPLQIADHIGYDTPRETLLKEILILTKMNWNSTKLGGLWPITLRFSRLVGDIMREIPPDQEPLANFKYYM